MASTEKGSLKSVKRLSSMLSLGSEPKLQVPASSVSAAPHAQQRGRSLSPGGHKLTRSVQRPVSQQFLSPVTAESTPLPDLSVTPSPRGRSPNRPHLPAFDSNSSEVGISTLSDTSSRRKKWLTKSRNTSEDYGDTPRPPAWYIADEGRKAYDLTPLLKSEKVPELWDENGDTYVYLFPRTAHQGPSFKIRSVLIASSSPLQLLLDTEAYASPQGGPSEEAYRYSNKPLEAGTQGLYIDVPPSAGMSPQSATSVGYAREAHLFLPISLSTDGLVLAPGALDSALSPNDIEVLVSVRNLFAFLAHQPLVATPKFESYFAIFEEIAGLLGQYGFSPSDGSSFGETVNDSFRRYVEELRLDDVRHSREKTIEGIILGEHFRSWDLYKECFVHAVGKYDSMIKLNDPKFDLISDVSRRRLEKEAMDLSFRLKSVYARLQDFEFPSLFSGIANSREGRSVDFKTWRMSFAALRKHVLGFYKEMYGSWPPKASSKKNNFEADGLNRLVLKTLYGDFCDIYDLLVDRSRFTTRTTGAASHHDSSLDDGDPAPRMLRRVLSEYDRSTPPVQPPVPFDIPKLPSLTSARPGLVGDDGKGSAKERTRKLKDNEMAGVISESYNKDASKSTPFLESFKAFEWKAARGKSLEEFCNQRNGYWLFVYAILQSLPMVVIDSPGIRWHEGVEYFLCQYPRNGEPWSQDETRRKSWYGIPGGTGVVSLPSAIVDHGPEGIFKRSHCWTAAEVWSMQGSALPGIIAELDAPLPPVGFGGQGTGLESSASSNRQSVVSLRGLEALPAPAGLTADAPLPRPNSAQNFEDILGVEVKDKKKRRSEIFFG